MNITYVVCDEHTLGYHDNGGMIGVIHSSVLKGAVFEVHPAPKFPSQFSSIRNATHQDFIDFRVLAPKDFKLAKAIRP